jgi:hypothetical protein
MVFKLLIDLLKHLVFPGDLSGDWICPSAAKMGLVVPTESLRLLHAFGHGKKAFNNHFFNPAIGKLNSVAMSLGGHRTIQRAWGTFPVPNGVAILFSLHATLLVFHSTTLVSHLAIAGTSAAIVRRSE